MRTNVLFVVFLSALLFTACAPDPRKQAEADALTLQSQQQAADQEQARALQLQEQTFLQQRKENASAQFDAMINKAMTFAGFALDLLLIAFALAAALMIRDVGSGLGRAIVRKAEVKANLIPLDPVTRQFPLLVSYSGNGRYTLANPNTNSVLELDTRNPAERLMIVAMAQTQALGTVAQAAQHSLPQNAQAISAIAVPVIEDGGE